jgi:hypothetical protein
MLDNLSQDTNGRWLLGFASAPRLNKNGKTLKDEKDRYLCIFPWKRSGDLGQRIRLLIDRDRYQLGSKEVRTAKATPVYAE